MNKHKKKQHINPLKDARCTGLELLSPVMLKPEGEAAVATQFEIEAYTGQVVDRWWGKLAIEVDGHPGGQIHADPQRSYQQ